MELLSSSMSFSFFKMRPYVPLDRRAMCHMAGMSSMRKVSTYPRALDFGRQLLFVDSSPLKRLLLAMTWQYRGREVIS